MLSQGQWKPQGSSCLVPAEALLSNCTGCQAWPKMAVSCSFFQHLLPAPGGGGGGQSLAGLHQALDRGTACCCHHPWPSPALCAVAPCSQSLPARRETQEWGRLGEPSAGTWSLPSSPTFCAAAPSSPWLQHNKSDPESYANEVV